jgi:hypothetical protein
VARNDLPVGGIDLSVRGSHLLSDWRDLINGLFVAILTAMLTGIIEILGNGAVFNWIYIKPV